MSGGSMKPLNYIAFFALALVFPLAAAQPRITVSPQSIVVNPVPTFSVEVFLDKDPSGNGTPSATGCALCL
jgi:hypothetical protein